MISEKILKNIKLKNIINKAYLIIISAHKLNLKIKIFE